MSDDIMSADGGSGRFFLLVKGAVCVCFRVLTVVAGWCEEWFRMSEGQDLIHQGVPPLPPRYRFRDLIWGEHALSDEGDRWVFLLCCQWLSSIRCLLKYYMSHLCVLCCAFVWYVLSCHRDFRSYFLKYIFSDYARTYINVAIYTNRDTNLDMHMIACIH